MDHDLIKASHHLSEARRPGFSPTLSGARPDRLQMQGRIMLPEL
jgi:hypothetical protein